MKSKNRCNAHSHLTIFILLLQSTLTTRGPGGTVQVLFLTHQPCSVPWKRHDNSAVKFLMQIRPQKDLTTVGPNHLVILLPSTFLIPTSRYQHRAAEQQQPAWKWSWSLTAPSISWELVGKSDSRAHQTCRIRSCIVTDPQRICVHLHLWEVLGQIAILELRTHMEYHFQLDCREWPWRGVDEGCWERN